MKTKILLAGKSRSGKDALASILNRKYGMTFASSSWVAAKTFIFDKMKDSHGYRTIEECYEDRHTGDNRALWYKYITEYNKDDPAKLAKQIVKDSDIYCGLRNTVELEECYRKGIFDLTFWIDASKRVEYVEPNTSITIGPQDCHFVLDNNGSEKQLEKMADFVWDHVQYMEARRG